MDQTTFSGLLQNPTVPVIRSPRRRAIRRAARSSTSNCLAFNSHANAMASRSPKPKCALGSIWLGRPTDAQVGSALIHALTWGGDWRWESSSATAVGITNCHKVAEPPRWPRIEQGIEQDRCQRRPGSLAAEHFGEITAVLLQHIPRVGQTRIVAIQEFFRFRPLEAKQFGQTAQRDFLRQISLQRQRLQDAPGNFRVAPNPSIISSGSFRVTCMTSFRLLGVPPKHWDILSHDQLFRQRQPKKSPRCQHAGNPEQRKPVNGRLGIIGHARCVD